MNLSLKNHLKKTEWSKFTETLTGSPLRELTNKSSSAVLLVKDKDTIIAFTFGYGRSLIDTKYFVQDFGIKTALNILMHDSLRSVKLYILDDQAVQKNHRHPENLVFLYSESIYQKMFYVQLQVHRKMESTL